MTRRSAGGRGGGIVYSSSWISRVAALQDTLQIHAIAKFVGDISHLQQSLTEWYFFFILFFFFIFFLWLLLLQSFIDF